MKWYAALLQASPMTELAMLDRPRILIVEDDVALEAEIARLIHEISPIIQLDWITTADELRSEIAHQGLALGSAYDLIVSDIRLPGKSSGLDLWKTCQDNSPATPFLLMSGIGQREFLAELQQRAKGLGQLPEFLPKPFSTAQIRERILHHLFRQDLLKKAA